MSTEIEDRRAGLSEAQPDPRRWLALVVIATAQLMVVLDASIVNIALPSAQRALHISDIDRQWVVTAYTLTFGGLLLLGGRIADYVGRKRMFIIGLAGFACSSALGGAAQNQAMLFGSRALQGVFAATLAPAALSLISITFTETKERARAFGVYGAIAGGGAAIGLIVGGVLTQYASWRWCLFVNVPIAVITAFAAAALVHESKAPGDTKYDIPGAILVTSGLVSLVYGFTEAAKHGVGWGSGTTLKFLGLALVLLAGFLIVEARSSNPLLPLRILSDRNRGGSYLAMLLVACGIFAMFLFLIYYFQVNLGYSPLKSGLAFLPFSGGIIVTATAVSSIVPKTGPKPLMMIGSVMATIGLFTFTFINDGSSWLTSVLPGELLMSIGLALIFVPLSNLALKNVSHHDAGVASAVLNTCQQIGGSLGTALLNTFYASAVANYLAGRVHVSRKLHLHALIHGYHVAFSIGVGLMFAAVLVIIFVVNAKKDDLPRAIEMAHGT